MKKTKAKKHLGQNFLVCERTIDKILQLIQAKTSDHIIEIGPGLGALTATLVEQCPQLICIEKDIDMVEHIRGQWPKCTVHHEDILNLKLDSLNLAPPLRIVGNLPYNISTPILFHLLEQMDCISDMIFMLQKEVVQRICATPGNKQYGRLSVMLQYHFQCEFLLEVPNSAFEPPPKVSSAMCKLIPYGPNRPFAPVAGQALADVVTHAFSMRRKTLRNGLKALFEPEQLTQLPVDLKNRPENLSVSDFVAIAQRLEALRQQSS